MDAYQQMPLKVMEALKKKSWEKLLRSFEADMWEEGNGREAEVLHPRVYY